MKQLTALLLVGLLVACGGPVPPGPDATFYLPLDDYSAVRDDIVARNPEYSDPKGRELVMVPGRFGNALLVGGGGEPPEDFSSTDLDYITWITHGVYRQKPTFWAAGKFHPESGTIAFWCRMAQPKPGKILAVGNVSFGRLDKDLLKLELPTNLLLAGEILDAAYHSHRVEADSPGGVLAAGKWTHVALAWDRGLGLKLYVDGASVASSWDDDPWWATQLPGVIQLSMTGMAYDELAIFDRPLSGGEIEELFKENRLASEPPPPSPELPDYARDNLIRVLAGDDTSNWMTLHSRRGESVRSFRQIQADSCADGNIPGWWLMDGRLELAWPHPYTVFTRVLGDADFHAERADIRPGTAGRVDYLELRGDLGGLNVLADRAGSGKNFSELARVPDGAPFYFPIRADLPAGSLVRLPFTLKYGTPAVVKGDLHLPLSGNIRVQEVDLWQVDPVAEPAGEVLFLNAAAGRRAPGSYLFAHKALTDRHSRRTVNLQADPSPEPASIPLGNFAAISLFGPRAGRERAIDCILFHLILTPSRASDLIFIRLHDPANPGRIWTDLKLKLVDLEAGRPQAVDFLLDHTDLILSPGEHLWIELSSAYGGDLIVGGDASTRITICDTEKQKALPEYVAWQLRPVWSQYSKAYEFMPWRYTGETVRPGRFVSFGGTWDMVFPTLAVLAHDPDNPTARAYRELVLGDRNQQGIKTGKKPPLPGKTPQSKAPDWAYWLRELYSVRGRIARFWADRQNPDGQVGGGWNDDTLIIAGFLEAPFLGDEAIKRTIMQVDDGLDKTLVYQHGYCDVDPIDPLHATDFVGYRGYVIMYALGQPRPFERALRTALHLDKPETVPLNYCDGVPFAHEKVFIDWYWGRGPQITDRKWDDARAIADSARKIVSLLDDVAVFRFTRAGVHTDDYRVPGSELINRVYNGGRFERIRVTRTSPELAASWSGEGASEDLVRWVRQASDKNLAVSLYNFKEEKTSVDLRLYRLTGGNYRIEFGPDSDGDGAPDRTYWARDMLLQRFSTIDIDIPPGGPYALTIRQSNELPRPKNLPDLAVGPGDLVKTAKGLILTVHNIGSAPAGHFWIELLDREGRVVKRTSAGPVPPPTDYVPKSINVNFVGISPAQISAVKIDPENRIDEILEENNQF